MGPSRFLQTDTFGRFDLLIKDCTQVKPPCQPEMKNKIFMSAIGETEVLPRCFNRIVTEGRIVWATTRIYSWVMALQSLGDSISIGIRSTRRIT